LICSNSNVCGLPNASDEIPGIQERGFKAKQATSS